MRKNQLGFTLIELIFVMVIISLIAVVGSQILAQGLNAYFSAKYVTDADWQGRIAIERMTRDIRSINSANSITTNSSSELTFTDNTGTSVSYTLSGSNLNRNSQTLANGVNSLTFTYFDKNGATTATATDIRYITISLNITQSGANYTIATSVYPRNLP